MRFSDCKNKQLILVIWEFSDEFEGGTKTQWQFAPMDALTETHLKWLNNDVPDEEWRAFQKWLQSEFWVNCPEDELPEGSTVVRFVYLNFDDE